MTDGEKMVYAAAFVAAINNGVGADMAAIQASSAVNMLREAKCDPHPGHERLAVMRR
jgi:hypothetical protein